QEGLDLIKEFEGVEPCVYKDVAGLDTVGAGHLITPEEKASGRFSNGCLSDEEINDLLIEDLDRIQRSVRGCVTQPVTQAQYDAMISMAYNIGPTAFCNSTMVKKLNEGSYEEVPNQMLRWNKARVGGTLQEVSGLTRRRVAEARLFAKQPRLTS